MSSRNRPLALVTGASNGIGYELALAFARGGFDLLATGRSTTIHAVEADFSSVGANVTTVQADLSTAEGTETLWKAVHDHAKPVEAGALNAGIGLGGAFLDNDLDEQLQLIEINISSVVRLTKYLADAMAHRGRGRILITSSISATLPTPYETVYGPSRAFTRMFALSLREELRGTGVTVTTLMPGATNSDFHARAGMNDTAFGPNEGKNDKAEIARQGFDALLTGKAEVVAGDRTTKRTALVNRLLPEPLKAAHHARKAKPRR
ncbi:SDR family NAD(P)-dependent oxidoreductase [Allosaccharopolyspora coralli]|uniref:SDR family NAD(P)-dependent oxidoreductase n=1 Tax=Allosaccharopolyspora coralli TaxID=2665642 RepID=A0A5Q3QEK8_9PSEU|nr:SDR family NAD(P)-dependent oxidoreductase [Allosaccharopolyspora coralli]QGK69899.1 SDR family NAD(P)-dependent oxidoreductase [Allosaccharopolyspora coralli]